MNITRYLIDTHILLWDLHADERLPDAHGKILLGDAPKFISVATIWEIAIKAATGKLRMPGGLLHIIAESNTELLPILPEHAMHTMTLPLHHRDPFDRILIAQAQMEKLAILTVDQRFSLYDVVVA